MSATGPFGSSASSSASSTCTRPTTGRQATVRAAVIVHSGHHGSGYELMRRIADPPRVTVATVTE